MKIPEYYTADFFKYPKSEKYCHAMYYGQLLRRFFKTELNGEDLKWLRKGIGRMMTLSLPVTFIFYYLII